MGKINKTPTIYQMEAAECGAASLAMILSYYGRHIPLEQLRIDAGVSRDGSKAGNLIRAAETYGLEGHGYKKEADALRTVQTPCILLFRRGHFVVLEGFRGQSATVNDPAVGRRRLQADALRELYAGVVLTFQPAPSFRKEKRSHDSELRRRILLNKKGIAVSVLFGAAASGCSFAALLSFCRLLDDVFGHRIGRISLHDLLPILLYVITAAFFFVLQSTAGNGFRTNYLMQSAKAFAEKLFRLPADFYEQRYIGEPVNRAKRNSAVDHFVAEEIGAAAVGFMTALCALGITLWCCPLLAPVSLICAAAGTGAALLTAAAARYHTNRLSVHENILAGKVYTGIREMETLKAAGAERLYLRSLSAVQKKLSKERQTAAAVGRAAAVCRIGLFLLSWGVLTAVCAKMLNAHTITPGKALPVLLLNPLLSASLNTVITVISKARLLKPNTAASRDVLRYPEDEIYDRQKTGLIRKAEGAVRLEKVTFSYNVLSPPVIRSLSADIRPGSIVAVVGASGSGKSTVAKLISGVYRPQSGRITLDGMDLASIPKSVINASISVVSQQPAIFSGTVRDNLTMWNSKIAEKDMIAAAKDACILEGILAREGQFEASVSENGVNFSGGQRRRLELARALATNPSVLVMDEATAALDAVTEQRIMGNIRRRGCTCIVIAHRLSAVRDCDMIVVMDHGSIVQAGTHSELAAAEGVYRSLLLNEEKEAAV